MLFHYDLSILKQPNMMAIYNNDPTNIQKLNTILFFFVSYVQSRHYSTCCSSRILLKSISNGRITDHVEWNTKTKENEVSLCL